MLCYQEKQCKSTKLKTQNNKQPILQKTSVGIKEGTVSQLKPLGYRVNRDSVEKAILPYSAQDIIQAKQEKEMLTSDNTGVPSLLRKENLDNTIQMWRNRATIAQHFSQNYMANPVDKVLNRTINNFNVNSIGDAQFFLQWLMNDNAQKVVIAEGGHGGEDGNNTYHEDFIMDCRTGRTLGHGPANPHKDNPHINMKDETGSKCAISINNAGLKTYMFAEHAQILLDRLNASHNQYVTIRNIFTTEDGICPRANLMNIVDAAVRNSILEYYNMFHFE